MAGEHDSSHIGRIMVGMMTAIGVGGPRSNRERQEAALWVVAELATSAMVGASRSGGMAKRVRCCPAKLAATRSSTMAEDRAASQSS